jgi:hypothetical protein
MGQAKLRGSFEERKQQAIVRNEKEFQEHLERIRERNSTPVELVTDDNPNVTINNFNKRSMGNKKALLTMLAASAMMSTLAISKE